MIIGAFDHQQTLMPKQVEQTTNLIYSKIQECGKLNIIQISYLESVVP